MWIGCEFHATGLHSQHENAQLPDSSVSFRSEGSAVNAVDLVSRWFHVGTAIVLLGGTAYIRFVLLPAASQLPDEHHQKLKELTVARWKRFVHGGILLLLLTGFYNYFRAEPADAFRKQYHMLVGIKILLALVLFGVASGLVGRSAAFARMRETPKRFLGLAVLLGAIIVAISGYLRVEGTAAIRAQAAGTSVETSAE